MKHYYHFEEIKEDGGGYFNPRFWDFLRIENPITQSPFYLAEDREAWIEKCAKDETLNLRAQAILDIMHPKYRCIHSHGVGCAYLEYLLKKEEPTLQLRCFDYTPKTVERLKKIFEEADEISLFDMRKDKWQKTDADSLILLYRVDTEFSDEVWSSIFEKMKKAGISHILFIPAQVLTIKKILYQITKYVFCKLLRKEITFAGYLRTKKSLVSLFDRFYEIECINRIYDLEGFLLRLRN